MDQGNEGPKPEPKELAQPIETPDRKAIYVFRYDNPNYPNRNPNTSTSKDEIVGKWFTDSLGSLKTYILMRPPGGSIKIAQIPKDRIEELRATNNHTTKDMDIEYDNFILPEKILSTAQTVPLDVAPSGNNRYLFGDLRKIGEFVDAIIPNLQKHT